MKYKQKIMIKKRKVRWK